MGAEKLMYYSRQSRLSRTIFGDENLLARFPTILLVCILDEILRELYFRKFCDGFLQWIFGTFARKWGGVLVSHLTES